MVTCNSETLIGKSENKILFLLFIFLPHDLESGSDSFVIETFEIRIYLFWCINEFIKLFAIKQKNAQQSLKFELFSSTH